MEKNYINFSAKDLLTRSCMQLKMFLDKPELRPQPTLAQYSGVDYQHQLIETIPDVIGEEMGNFIVFDNVRIYFSNDIITKNGIIEVKYVDKTKEVPEWYFNNSILQCAVYKALTVECKNELRTAAFHIKSGNIMQNHKFNNDMFEYILYFGNEKYKVELTNQEKLIKFLKFKVQHCLTWDNAKLFDGKYKRREFELLKNCFKFEKI